jgi:hypothetical protein
MDTIASDTNYYDVTFEYSTRAAVVDNANTHYA